MRTQQIENRTYRSLTIGISGLLFPRSGCLKSIGTGRPNLAPQSPLRKSLELFLDLFEGLKLSYR